MSADTICPKDAGVEVTPHVTSGACDEDAPQVSVAGQGPGESESTSGPDVEPAGIASATYLPEGYEAASSEEAAPGVTSKRLRIAENLSYDQ